MRTPLYENHLKLGAKMIEFGGWDLPVEYSGIIEEHRRVRSAAGLFDVSHMGEILITGPDAESAVQRLITNDISKAPEKKVIYSPMCYENGGVVDDLMVYKYSGERYLLVVNAANTEKDFIWIRDNLSGNARAENVSNSYAQLAIQGPEAEDILQRISQSPLSDIGFFFFNPDAIIGGVDAIVSRTGYTGEDGFEIYVPWDRAPDVWERILEAGRSNGLAPIGLGARDTLRLEAALPLYGHELSRDITPLEAGLAGFVKLGKDQFIGKDALAAQKSTGTARKLAGFEMVERGIPRNDYEVRANGRTIGKVTSGTWSPTLEKNIGIALIETGYSEEGTEIDIIVRNRPVRARVVNLPFYRKRYKK
jgi:aminomethyltransferase